MARYIITPWRHQTDLLEVRAQIYGQPNTAPTPESQRNAVDRITAWKLRGNLPHAVESTALLIDAQLHHHHQQDPSSQPSHFSLRAVYSAAFTRFITGFCDIGRSRDGQLQPRSMLEIARQISMPEEFVALRHEATHEEMPSLGRLVRATEEGLGWLWRVYWSRLESEGDGDGMGVEVEVGVVKDEARKVFRKFRSLRRDAFRAKLHASAKHNADVESIVKECSELCRQSEPATEAVATVLVEDKFLLPSNRELGQAIQGAFMMWDPLLNGICQEAPEFSTVLIRALLPGLDSKIGAEAEQDVDAEAVCLWLLHLVSDTRNLQSEAVKFCCLHPGYWSRKLAEDLLDSNEELKDAWQELFEASLLREDAEAVAKDAQMDLRSLPLADRLYNPVEQQMDRSGPDVVGWRRSALAPQTPIGIVA